jgi:DNA replication ATP-dependent helicase Dna2
MIIDNFNHCGVKSDCITIITPFVDQQFLLQTHLKNYGVKQVMTIDKAQGIDSDIVIISLTKQTGDKGVLLKDLKRLNVALTRAKKKLILIGTHEYLKVIKPLDKILQKMHEEGWEQEVNNFDD